VTSTVATLTAGARAPKRGDMRYLQFQQVTLPGFMSTYGGGGGVLGAQNYSFGSALGTPLTMGSTVTLNPGCEWEFSHYPLPPPMNNMAMYYQEAFLQDTTVASYLQSIAAPNLVITSMDIEPRCNDMAVSWIENSQGGFDQRLEVVPPSQIQAQATADGQDSRIITAVSFDGSGNANLLSYGWTSDTTTIYETKSILVSAGAVQTAATNLAAEGYFISAFGGDDSNGYILMGTRVKGDTLPRQLNVNGTLAPHPDTSTYFTMVVYLNDPPNAGVEAWEQ
jgi:hypothetical protein